MPESLSPTQKMLSEWLVDVPANLAKSLFGIEEAPDESAPGKWANITSSLGQAAEGVVRAGLPIAAITKGKPLLHGTGAAIEQFNPAKYHNAEDTLGSMIHFTTDPGIAEEFAQGNYTNKFNTARKQNIIRAEPEAKNVLDLAGKNQVFGTGGYVNNTDDLAQALASLSPTEKSALIENFKANRRAYSTPGAATNELRRDLVGAFTREPESFQKTPFDAIRYWDMGHEPSFAVPNTTPIKTPAGVPLNNPGRPLKVVRMEGSGPTAELQVAKPNPLIQGRKKGYGGIYGKNFTESVKDVKYTADDIENMYMNNIISSAEKNYLYENNLQLNKSKYTPPSMKAPMPTDEKLDELLKKFGGKGK